MNYEWVFFDFGGTLTWRLDPESVPQKPSNAYGEIFKEWFTANGRSVDAGADELQALTEKAHKATEGQPGGVDWLYNECYYVRWMRWIYEQIGIDGIVAEHELASAWHFMCWKIGERYSNSACDSVVSTLEELKQRGYRLGVFSNNSGYVCDGLAYLQIDHFFEIVLDSAREGRVKPDPEVFRGFARKANTECENIFYVGDSYQCDVIGATLVGMGMAWIGGDDRMLPDAAVRIERFDELLEHLPARDEP